MDDNASWAVAAGSGGVFFTPGPGNAATAPPEAEIWAVLPDGSELSPTLQTPDVAGGTGGYVFDPPLPDGSALYLNGALLCSVGPPGQ
ncbi:MAG: hypothetical protein GY926_08210 [bacterium]|nr:hypothetical protein [bacterium]